MAIDFGRVLSRLEEHFARQEYAEAERLLCYWREEATASGDVRTSTQVDNELLGLYRRTNEKEKALAVAERLMPMLEADNVGDATILLNIATNYCHFGMPEKAAPLYATAERTFLQRLGENDYRLAGLYNNMASMHTSTKEYPAAAALYRKALCVMRKITPVMPELAVTLVNLAVCLYMEDPLAAEVDECMGEAYRVLTRSDVPEDGNMAFVLSKVIPVFKHLGYASELGVLSDQYQRIRDNA